MDAVHERQVHSRCRKSITVASGSTVRVRDSQRLITAGPFAETTEQLGGYYLIDVENLDEAIAIAVRLPPVKKGTVEIRPLFKLDGLPTEKLFAEPTASESQLKRFMFLCYDDEEAWRNVGPEAHHAAMLEAVELTHRLDARGQYVSASVRHRVVSMEAVQLARVFMLEKGRRIGNAVKHFEVPISEKSAYVDRFLRNRCAHDA